MKRCALTAAAIALAVVSIVGGAGRTAHAAQLAVQLTTESPVTAGQPNPLTATVTDGGQPAGGISVTFYATETFARVTGDAEIGRAVTDAQGIASIDYEPRQAGSQDLRADAMGKDGTIAKATTTITIDGTVAQEYVQTAGIKIPGVNVWLIMGLLSVVWGTLLFIAVTVIRIAAVGRADGAARGGTR